MSERRQQPDAAQRAQARLSRELCTLLTYWGREGVIEPEIDTMLQRIEEAWEDLHNVDEACRCDPPGSGEEWCTGHCGYLSEERQKD